MVVFFTLPYSVTIISRRTSIVFSLFFFFFFIVLFIYFWLYWVFAAAQTFSSCGEQELLSSCTAWASHCSGFSWCRAQALACAGFSTCSIQAQCAGFSTCSIQAQQLWLLGSRPQLNSCGPWAQLLCGIWGLPGSGIEPMFPAVAGRFFTTVSPGQSSLF